MSEVFKFRGCDMLYYGFTTEIADGTSGTRITFSAPKVLAPVIEAGKTTPSEVTPHYGNNKALINVVSEGADEITFSVFGIPSEVLAEITGKHYNPIKQVFTNSERDFNYCYVMWREKLTDGRYRYNVAYKGTFNVPDVTTATEDDGTDANGQELTFTSIFTETVFENGKASKGYYIEDGVKKVNPNEFFERVWTQDDVSLPTE